MNLHYELTCEQRTSPYDFAYVCSTRAYADAVAKGCTVVTPEANQLFIDIDNAEDRDVFSRNLLKVEKAFGAGPLNVKETPSPSGEAGHWHIVVELPREVTPMERILLQAVLGSDRVREALSWIRLINDDPIPTLFFEKQPAQLAAGVQ